MKLERTSDVELAVRAFSVAAEAEKLGFVEKAAGDEGDAAGFEG